jgi:hypothetical protein
VERPVLALLAESLVLAPVELVELLVQVSLLAREPPPAPNPSRPCLEGDPIFFRLRREEGLVFRTRSIHRTLSVTWLHRQHR